MSTDLHKHPSEEPGGDPAGPSDSTGTAAGGTPPPPWEPSSGETPPPPWEPPPGGWGTPSGGQPSGGQPSGGQPSGGQPVRRLRRDSRHRVVSGVAAGLARYTGVDPVVFRVLFVVSSIFGGVGVVLYAAGWLFLPDDDDQVSPAEALAGRGHSTASRALTILVILIGCGALASALAGRGDAITVLLLAVLATFFLLRRARRGPIVPVAWAPTAPAAPRLRQLGETPTLLASHAERTLVADLLGAATGTGLLTLEEADDRMARAFASRTRGDLAGLIVDLPPAWVDEWELGRADSAAPPPVAYQPPRKPSLLGPLTLLVAVLAVGVALVIDSATGVDVSLAAYLGIAVGVIGLGLVVGTWFGRARWLVLPAIPLAVAMAATSIVPLDLHGGIGEQTAHPYAAAAIAPSYQLGAGQLTLDLTQVRDWPGQSARTSIRLGAGQLVVRLPATVDLVLRSHVRAGTIRIVPPSVPDRSVRHGYDIRRDLTDLGPDGAGGGTLTLDATVDAGQVEVLRAAA